MPSCIGAVCISKTLRGAKTTNEMEDAREEVEEKKEEGKKKVERK